MITELLSHFFTTDYNPTEVITWSYDYWLVALSVFIAAFTSTVSLHLVGISIHNNSQIYRAIAIFTSGLAMGCGIWAMHFIGMLAFHVPTTIYYDPTITAYSILPGIVACCAALYITTRKSISTNMLIAGGIIVGSGIGIMHYTGMQAIQMGPLMRYDPVWFCLSVLVAVLLAIAALITQFKLRKLIKHHSFRVVVSGCIMGAAISCMHYFGMNSAIFIVDDSHLLDEKEQGTQNFIGLATAIVTIAVMMFVAAANWLIRYRQLLSEIGENETRLKAILETAVDGIITISDHGIVQGYNPAAERILGWSADEVIGNNIKMLMPEPDQSRHDDYLSNYKKTHYASIIGSGRELLALHKNGTHVPIRLGVGEVKLNDSTTLYVGFLTDISHRHKIEKELRQNEKQLSSLMNNMPGVAFRCRLDKDWSMLYINDAVEALTGWTANAFLNRTIHLGDLIHPEDAPIAEALLSNPERNKTYTIEYRLQHRKGHTVWILDRGTFHISNDDNEPDWIDGLLFDISERRQMEEILREAKVKAEAAAEAKASFMANMSHEIRTPMNAIIGFSDILSHTSLDNDQSKYLKSISNSAKSLLHLLNDILDSAKLEKGKLDLEEMDFSLYELIDTVISTLWIQARTKNLSLNLQIEKDVGIYYYGAPDRIRQVLMNLLGNALKFTEKGEINLHVYLEHSSVHFDIIDTGIGISQDRLDAIFAPFTQADASMSRRYGGTGLGTTISKQLVELMGGQIYATSTGGEGSTFGFSLPLKPGRALIQNSSYCAFSLPPLNILAADDIEQNLELLTLLLSRQGHEVTTVSDGLEAVAAYKKDNFDLILMDVQMPNMDGLTAAQTIRLYEQTNNLAATPIIALTASVLNEDKVAANNAGMTGFATKPVNVDLLNAEIAKVMGINLEIAESIATQEQESVAIRHDKGLALWGDIELYAQELERFAKDASSHQQKAKQLIESGLFSALKQHAHALKGVSGNLALPLISQAFSDLESAARKEDTTAASACLLKLEDVYAQFLTEVLILTKQATHQDQLAGTSTDLAKLPNYLSLLKQHAQSAEINDALLTDFIKDTPADFLADAKRISNAFSDFEFDEAKDLLEQFEKQLQAHQEDS